MFGLIHTEAKLRKQTQPLFLETYNKNSFRTCKNRLFIMNELDAIETTENAFQGYYLDWMNNFLTVQAYASHYGITDKEANQRIRIGKLIHNKLAK